MSYARKIPLAPLRQKELAPPRQKETLLSQVKRRRRHGQITVLRSLASSEPMVSEASNFHHTHHMGEPHALRHSLKHQVEQGRNNANVVSYDSHRQATDHRRDHTFRYLSTNFALND
jgi:hypothetical protein